MKLLKPHYRALSLVSLLVLLGSGCNVAATGHNVQGKRLYEQGQFSAAINSFQQALASNPRNADAYYNLARTYHYLGKQQKNQQWLQHAEQLYNQALALDPNHTKTYRGLAVILAESGRPNDAFGLLRDWQVRNPTSEEPLIELSRLSKEFGSRPRAMQYLVDALALNSQNPRALKAMGQLREEQGEYQLALNNYMRSYQANNLQADVASRIAALQGRAAYQSTIPLPGQPAQPGQPRFGEANPYVPR